MHYVDLSVDLSHNPNSAVYSPPAVLLEDLSGSRDKTTKKCSSSQDYFGCQVCVQRYAQGDAFALKD